MAFTDKNLLYTQQLLALSFVPRWGIVPMHRTQSVAEHSFRVAVIYRILRAERMGCGVHAVDSLSDPRCDWKALIHDHSEHATGDLPAPFSRLLKDKGSIPDELMGHELEMADLIEAYTWLREWGATGGLVVRVLLKIRKKINSHPYRTDHSDTVEKVITAIISEMPIPFVVDE